MKIVMQVLSVFLTGYLLLGVRCRSNKEKLWTLEEAKNRELFLSALQSYFRNRGIHVDRDTPRFFMFPEHRKRGNSSEHR